jgi:hypothetical protein
MVCPRVVFVEDPQFLNKAFKKVCSYGHLHMAQWLLSTFPSIDQCYCNHWALDSASARGHQDVVQWLLALENNRDRRRLLHFHAFQAACIHGQLHLAKWLQGADEVACFISHGPGHSHGHGYTTRRCPHAVLAWLMREVEAATPEGGWSLDMKQTVEWSPPRAAWISAVARAPPRPYIRASIHSSKLSNPMWLMS